MKKLCSMIMICLISLVLSGCFYNQKSVEEVSDNKGQSDMKKSDIMQEIDSRVKEVNDRIKGELYSIYFHNDELLHTKVGPFSKGGSSIDGDMANVKAVIEKDSSYAFVLEDYSLCLENAYK